MALDPITAGIDFFSNIVNKVFPDKSEQEKQAIAQEMAREAQEVELLKGQQEINKIEAQSSNLWNSGWRPGFGWVCVAAFAWTYVLEPFLSFFSALAGLHIERVVTLNMAEIMPVLGGVLGLGYYRTAERIKGVIPRGK